MANISTDSIKNFVLAGHAATGKTTFLETMLFKKGITTRLGRVEDKNTVSDFETEEKDRGYSIFSSVCHLTHNDCLFNVIDLPGYTDFYGAAYGPFRVVELALIFVCGTKGVEINTKRIWDLAIRNEVPKIIVISKIDAERAKFDEVLAEIQDLFGSKCKLIGKPEGAGTDLKKIASIFSADGDEGLRGEFIESALEADDKLLEEYLEGKEITHDILKELIPKALAKGSVIPIMPISALKDLGIDELMNFIQEFGPKPTSLPRQYTKNNELVTIEQNADKPVTAYVFKTISDPFVGKINYFRVFAGSVSGQSNYWLSTTQKSERFGNINKVQGKDMATTDVLVCGDIGAVAKVDSLATGATFASDTAKFAMPTITPPTPMVSVAIEPKSRDDEQRLNDSLRRICEEDLTFKMDRNAQTKELVAWGMGNLHIDILLAKMKRKYNVVVNTRVPKVAYLETITSKSESRYRHKKQTGGAGQFAEVAIKMEPSERGKGFQFLNEIFGGVISGGYIPSVEKGTVTVMEEGILAGFPIVDVTVRLWDGKEHPVDSKDIAFQIAGREAFKEAFMDAKPTFLEPIATIEILVASNFLGDVISDLNSRRGRIIGTETLGAIQMIKATVPYAEVMTYSNDLRSMTGGEGSYGLEFSHYDLVPTLLRDQIIQKFKAAKEKD